MVKRLLFICCLLTVFGCQDADYTYCNLPAKFVFENVYQASALNIACNSMGEFCTVTFSKDGKEFVFKGSSVTSNVPLTAIVGYTGFNLGLSGLIIGLPNIPEIGKTESQVVCFDLACSNCYKDYAISFGYGYNWVPARNWLVNVMVMPTVAFYNRVKVTKYASNYNFFELCTDTEDYGTWDPEKRQWSNGEKERPLPLGEDFEKEDLSWQKDVDNWEIGTETKHTRWNLNVNVHAGITYFGKDWFASIYGQMHRFSYNHDNMNVKIYDWYLLGSIGLRF